MLKRNHLLRYTLPFALLILLLLGFACSPQPSATATQLRLISLAPNITELVFALQQDAYLVGVTTYCNYPEAAQNITKIGDFSHPQIEKIVALQPTLVLLTGLEQENLRVQLETLAIPYLQIFPQNIASLQQAIQLLGNKLNATAQADSLVAYIQDGINAVRQDSLAWHPRVFMEISGNPIMTVDNETLLGEMVALAGGENVFPDLMRNYSRVNSELIVEKNPEIMIITYPTEENIAAREGWENVSALQTGTILQDLDPDVLLRPGPRIVEGLQLLHEAFKQYGQEHH